MTHEEAVQLIKKGIKPKAGTWLDLGAGSGTFTLALAELLPSGSRIYAIDKDRSVLEIPESFASNEIIAIRSDFENLPEIPLFDGILMANALHYVPSPLPFLQKLLKNLRPGGAFILIEYDLLQSNPWVPYPIPFQQWQELSSKAGLSEPHIFNEKFSRYNRSRMYAAAGVLENRT